MDDYDLTPAERTAFARLAATMPDNPARPHAVRKLVRRRQRRRVATRAGLGVAAAASVVGAGVIITNRPASSGQVAAVNQPREATSSAPSSTTVAAKPDCDAVNPAITGDTADTVSSDPKAKVHGTITAITDATISVQADPGGSLAEITAGFATDAAYVDAGHKSTTRPTLSVGEQVGLEASQASDGSYSIDYLEVEVPDRPKSDAEADQPDPGAPESKAGKAYGTVTAVADSTLTIQAGPDVVLPNGATSITATLADTTLYYDGNTQLSDKPTIAAGDQVAFAFDANADGTYVITSVQLDVTTTKATANGDGQPDPTDPAATFGKTYGTVTAVSDSSITIHNSTDVKSAGSPDSITAAFTDTTQYFDGDTTLSAKPNLAVGDQLAIAYSIAKDGTTSLLSLELHAPAPHDVDLSNGTSSAQKTAIVDCLNTAHTSKSTP
jgi:hypothetical protein